MSKNDINNIILKLVISRTNNIEFEFQYYSVLDNGVIVKAEGFIINKPTRFLIELSDTTRNSFSIKECLIPGLQRTVTVEKQTENEVVVFDKDNDLDSEDYNFIIIAVNDDTGKQIVCDPQIKNRGRF